MGGMLVDCSGGFRDHGAGLCVGGHDGGLVAFFCLNRDPWADSISESRCKFGCPSPTIVLVVRAWL